MSCQVSCIIDTGTCDLVGEKDHRVTIDFSTSTASISCCAGAVACTNVEYIGPFTGSGDCTTLSGQIRKLPGGNPSNFTITRANGRIELATPGSAPTVGTWTATDPGSADGDRDDEGGRPGGHR
jgi:hypothetical protein